LGFTMTEKDQDKASGSSCSLDFLRNNLGRNETAARRLVELFLDTYPGLLERLDVSARNRDLLALQNVVHDIRGNCVLFSAQACLDQTRFMENALRDQAAAGSDGANGIDWVAESEKLGLLLSAVEAELRASLSADDLGQADGSVS